VVGDRQILVAGIAGRLGHLLDRGGAVGGGRVGVKVALQVFERDQLGERPRGGCLELAAILA
jgi:hypothetical protein